MTVSSIKGPGKIILIEGIEGTGKTTQVKRLADDLRGRGYKVLESKEPGSKNIPMTMDMRALVLDKKHEATMTRVGRELIMQAIRSITIQKEVLPATHTHDFIIQDRGLLSSLAYGESCGNDQEELLFIVSMLAREAGYPPEIVKNIRNGVTGSIPAYDQVIFLTTDDVEASLSRALAAKKEFEAGDVIEAKGVGFQKSVVNAFDRYIPLFKRVDRVEAVMAQEKTEAKIEEAIQATLKKILAKILDD